MSNYSTHAAEEMKLLIRDTRKILPAEDVKELEDLVAKLQQGIKFILPMNGRYLNKSDPYTPEDLGLIKLPYPLVVLEYACNHDEGDIQFPGTQQLAPRRIMICETTDKGIDVYCLYSDPKGQWGLSGSVVTVPKDAELKPVDPDQLREYQRSARKPGITDRKGGKPILAMRFEAREIAPHLNDLLAYKHQITRHQMVERQTNEILDDINVLFEFCLAINCSNVDLETVPPSVALNKKRQRSGKLPFYEYKVLKLKTDSVRYKLQGEKAADSGEKVTRRQHLRRGHIRHYDPAVTPWYRQKKAVWIEAQLVGDPTKGKIDKEYQVE